MKLVFFISVLTLSTLGAQAQVMQSYCHSSATEKGVLKGKAVDQRLPIASVSKLVTSYWALRKTGPHFQYHTRIHFKKVSPDQYDVHIQGSRDPYFGREKFHFLISELNRRNIKKVRRLSYDENFLFLQDLDIVENPFNRRGNKWVWFNWFLNPHSPERTRREIEKGVLRNYSVTLTKAKKLKIQMVEKPSITISQVQYTPASEKAPITNESFFYVRSSKMITLLKEMNRNSNNFAAVAIFDFLGGPREFKDFILKDLNLNQNSILFYEGSGNRTAKEPRYNEASCRALLRIFRALDLTLESYGFKLQDVVSVIGHDGLVNEGTGYSDDYTHSNAVAKTGTIDAAISLGGVLNTQPEKIYFMFNVKPRYPGETRQSRLMVGAKVRALAKENSSHLKEMDYTEGVFLSFDASPISHPLAQRLK